MRIAFFTSVQTEYGCISRTPGDSRKRKLPGGHAGPTVPADREERL